MFSVLSNRCYRHLFLAQAVALLGTGLATVALALLAFDLAGGEAALVLGTAFTIKMAAYVVLSPLAGAFADRIPRRAMLVALDLIRAAVALTLPFVTEIWQIFLLIFLLQAASAAFTPAFQAAIPDILTDEEDYTKALSLSRLAYDLEGLLSPLLAAMLLSFVAFETLFSGTALGFVASACLILSVALPSPRRSGGRGIWMRATRGLRIYLATPRLRGLFALSLSVAAAGAMVIVNTVVLVRGGLGLADNAVALTLGAFGAGSMLAAVSLPRLLDRRGDRPVMLAGAGAMTLVLSGLGAAVMIGGMNWAALLASWFLIGLGYSAALTPSGRLLRRSAHAEDRPGLFAAQFALSHLCWLVTYPLAGWLQTAYGGVTAMLVLAMLSAFGFAAAWLLWPEDDPVEVCHSHEHLPSDHPHVAGGLRHSHPFVIDDLHPTWPEARRTSLGG